MNCEELLMDFHLRMACAWGENPLWLFFQKACGLIEFGVFQISISPSAEHPWLWFTGPGMCLWGKNALQVGCFQEVRGWGQELCSRPIWSVSPHPVLCFLNFWLFTTGNFPWCWEWCWHLNLCVQCCWVHLLSLSVSTILIYALTAFLSTSQVTGTTGSVGRARIYKKD